MLNELNNDNSCSDDDNCDDNNCDDNNCDDNCDNDNVNNIDDDNINDTISMCSEYSFETYDEVDTITLSINDVNNKKIVKVENS